MTVVNWCVAVKILLSVELFQQGPLEVCKWDSSRSAASVEGKDGAKQPNFSDKLFEVVADDLETLNKNL